MTHSNPLTSFWRYLREVTGDDAYERYLAHHQAHHAGEAHLTRQQFFTKRQNEKWSKVSRCC
ncbi:MAG TPA: YbdD/YjiX family protein [Burkholderiales bacterium]